MSTLSPSDKGPKGETPTTNRRDPILGYIIPDEIGGIKIDQNRFVYQNPNTWPEELRKNRKLVDEWKFAEDEKKRNAEDVNQPDLPLQEQPKGPATNPSGGPTPNSKALHPASAHICKYFDYDHLPEHLQIRSKPFCDLAFLMTAESDGPELTVALRKLLEAKDAYVRSFV